MSKKKQPVCELGFFFFFYLTKRISFDLAFDKQYFPYKSKSASPGDKSQRQVPATSPGDKSHRQVPATISATSPSDKSRRPLAGSSDWFGV